MGPAEGLTVTATNASARLTMPPWLWVWLAGYLLPGVYGEIGGIHSAIVTYFRPPGTSAPLPRGLATVGLLSAIFETLVNAMVAAGLVVVIFPQLRGRWVEWRFKLASDDPALTDMQQFVASQDPSIELTVSLRADQMARIYPVGWRRARIAVFRPLTVLWEGDPEAAKAILLHEAAHGRQGDHLIMGLGSPFVWLVRIGAPAYVLLSLIPATVYLAAGGGMASFATSAPDAVLIPAAILLPVTALWLAEFHADQQAAHAIGPDALRKALLPTSGRRASLATRAIALLSHPPRRLRLRFAAASPAGAVALMAVWPAALVALFLLLLGMDALGPLWSSLTRRIADVFLKSAVHALAVEGRPVLITTAVVLLAWPALTVLWERLWSSEPRLGRIPPWPPYLATACLPIGLLLLSLAPPGQPARRCSVRPDGGTAARLFTDHRLGARRRHRTNHRGADGVHPVHARHAGRRRQEGDSRRRATPGYRSTSGARQPATRRRPCQLYGSHDRLPHRRAGVHGRQHPSRQENGGRGHKSVPQVRQGAPRLHGSAASGDLTHTDALGRARDRASELIIDLSPCPGFTGEHWPDRTSHS